MDDLPDDAVFDSRTVRATMVSGWTFTLYIVIRFPVIVGT